MCNFAFQVTIQGRSLNCEVGMKNRFYGEDGEQCGVEQLALQYYSGEGGGWQGIHTESSIWLTIFGLLMWDILFSDVPGVFQTRFQVNESSLVISHSENENPHSVLCSSCADCSIGLRD